MNAVAEEVPVREAAGKAPALRELPPPSEPAPAARGLPGVRPRAVVASVSLASVLGGVVWLLMELGGHPIDSVRIAANFHQLQRGDLETVVQPHLGQSFFGVDVDAVRAAARSLPWVREASVRRVWPGSLHIAIVEREAAFRWADTGLLEDDGTLFEPAERLGFDALPMLAGPVGSESEVRERFAVLKALLEPVELGLRELELSTRGAWRARLANGVTLLFGRDAGIAPTRRFVRAYPAALSARIGEVDAVDLRYANGFSVRWKPVPTEASEG